jgi:hypothetical protein
MHMVHELPDLMKNFYSGLNVRESISRESEVKVYDALS